MAGARLAGDDRQPVGDRRPVGRWLVFDALTVAYGLLALLYACIAGWSLATPPLPRAARALAVVSRCYGYAGDAPCLPGRDNGLGRIGDAEWHAYSTVWLAFSGIALAVGLYRHNEWLRRAALAGIGLVAAKVFLSDMAQLEGVLRALSFLGLGGVLVGIGYA